MIKTIVVHIDGSARQDSRLCAAARLACEHEAHLVGSASTGISWVDVALLAGSVEPPVPVVDVDALRATARQRLEAFTTQAARLGVASIEARLAEEDAAFGLLLQSRYADLLVLSQDPAQAGKGESTPRGLPAHLALHGVRPVLVVPETYGDAPIAGTVVAGWDGSSQALRAIDAALPLLCRAGSVKLVLVNPDTATGLHGEEPGADLALYLARHGVPVEVIVERTSATVGATLVQVARDSGAGLIVAGAYGHSRYREWVLGGATRELLERAPVPLLLAH
ncbi:universal stress protein [Massilia agri]|uniref:Universal stress protein n=1 Tax=Massilia agri TaxID=1886785 RepID=A0ABT2AKT9_9BURK|nr:universal stress protein [Massilia agri]MCS0596839.1 universal stress protein [Massilia agri]